MRAILPLSPFYRFGYRNTERFNNLWFYDSNTGHVTPEPVFLTTIVYCLRVEKECD